ncbi:MAG: response regulator [Vicinamibacterales bacterium]
MTAPVRPSILVVEDEGIVATDLQQTLEELGYDLPVLASSAEEALARACERRPDLVLMDVRINGARDGIETTELLKAQFDVPVVYLTAHADDATLQRAKSTAPHGYLVKPIKAVELKSAVEISIARHELEQRLRRQERWFAATLESIADAVVAVDLDGTVAFVNPVAELLTGVRSAAALGRPVADVLNIASPDGELPVLSALREQRVIEVPEGRLVNAATGDTRVVVDSAAPVVDPRSGDTLGAVMVFRDVTDRERLRARLEQAERLASVGTLAAGVAHEVNNPLTVVLANAEYVRDELQQAPASGPQVDHLVQALDDVKSAATRIGQIVADLKLFARRPAGGPAVADVMSTLEWALRATAHEFRSRARLVRRLAPVPAVAADEARLGQVFVNLLTNAAHAIPAGRIDDHAVTVTTSVDGQGRVAVEVRDTGRGMAPEVLARVFEPFFTTRRDEGGTGLGLAICHGIVASFGGDITVESDEGLGTAVRVLLLAAEAPQERSAAPVAVPAASAVSSLRGRLLVVDDESLLAEIIGRMLSAHDVRTLSDARDALALLDRGERFDVLLVDVTMPHMSGVAFYQAVRERHPELAPRVIFMSGGVFEPEVEGVLARLPNRRIEKPFHGVALRSLVGEVLAQHATGS